MANSNDGFYLRLTLAILCRAGMDAANKSSPHCAEAHEFLQSDFARFAHDRLLENVGVIDFAPPAYHLSAFHTRSAPGGDGQE
jgi:hypothetical protein